MRFKKIKNNLKILKTSLKMIGNLNISGMFQFSTVGIFELSITK